MILKIVLVLGVIGIIYFLFIKKKPLLKNSKLNKNTQEESNDMIECSSCGIYSQLDETIISNNKYYCSNDCMEKI